MADKELMKKWICEYLDSKHIKYNIKTYGEGYEIVHNDASSIEEFKELLETKKIQHEWGQCDTDDEYDYDKDLQEWNDSFQKPTNIK